MIDTSDAAPLAQPNWREALLNRRMLICIFTGFSSGLPLYILINLLPAWLRTEHVDLKAIGLFALIGLPFTWKFIWSPLVDRYALPLLQAHRSPLASGAVLGLAVALWHVPLVAVRWDDRPLRFEHLAIAHDAVAVWGSSDVG